MPTLAILDGFCFDHGHFLAFTCPKCTKAKAQQSVASMTEPVWERNPSTASEPTP